MDQIRTAMAWLKRHHFWVLSVLVALVALVCWYSGSGTLAEEYVANELIIKAEFNNQQTLQNQPFKPNEKIHEAQSKEIEEQKVIVKTIWDKLWERQREQVLKWPADLSAAFRDYVSKRKFGDNIPRNLCANYRDYIDRHFENLPKSVGARIIPAGETGGYGGRFGGEMSRSFNMRGEGEGMMGQSLLPVEEDYLCQWLDQGRVREELNFPVSPTPIRIWVTQENLWVYQTLLNVIAETNAAAGADRMSNAAVRTIATLEVGRLAAQASRGTGRIEVMQPLSSGTEEGMGSEFSPDGGMMEGAGEMPRGSEFEMGFSEGGQGTAMTPEQEKTMLLAGRYLDAEGKPIGLGGGASPEDGGMADPSAVEVSVDTGAPFKRLPIRMTLEMDQRWLTHLISLCASQPLQVEVTEVRINPADLAGGFGGAFGGEGSYRGGMGGGAGGGGSTFQPRANSGEIQTFKQNPHLANVVIQGIIYIFNEPDTKVLQQPADQVAINE